MPVQGGVVGEADGSEPGAGGAGDVDWRPEPRLPPERELATVYGVACDTIRRALHVP